MTFAPVDPKLDLVAIEETTLERWRQDDVFSRSLSQRDGAQEWVFYEGPPTANAAPGTHHIWARVFKDLYPRYWTMRGRYVARRGGWDTHGLPVEIQVEKDLGFSGKSDIEAYGIKEFNERCRESVTRYVDDFTRLTERIGMWIDTEDAYWTLSNNYIESVWWILKQMWNKDLIYEGTKVVPYCGRCGTALSSHETALGYQDVTENSVYVRFPLIEEDVDLLVWTTTPWTLISNVAVAVSPGVEYVRVETKGRDVIMAAARVTPVLGEHAHIKGTVDAKTLLGHQYSRPFTDLPLANDAHVVSADFVTTDEGSGIVHLAPAFGEIDREVAETEGLPELNPVNERAQFTDAIARFAGTFVKDTDAAITKELRDNHLLVDVVPYTHSYPHCWRCSTPLIYWAKPTWFARTTAYRDQMISENEKINWYPDHIKHGRFGEWLANNVDWALSRDRYWGTPLPIWRCEDCGNDTCVGSIDELKQLTDQDLGDLELHRPFVDDVIVRCQCGGDARRVGSVLDVWFDSGSMPTAQFHYPFENQAIIDEHVRFPADFICEALDQTRGWFYSLLAVNTLVFGQTPYRNVLCLNLLVDKDGQKMSKSKGNTIDPWLLLNDKGADALRWYFFASGSPWTPRRVFTEGIDEAVRKFHLTLWNTYSFFVTYANLDGWEPGPQIARTHVLDRWIRSRLYTTIQQVTNSLADFDAYGGAQALEQFVNDLSNWYVRRSRPRFWKSSDSVAHATLYECLTNVALLLAPFCPFAADEIYRNLTGADSVHLADWPEADDTAIDSSLEEEMSEARQIVSLGRSARTESKLKVRQPLRRAIALTNMDFSSEVEQEITDELNVKQFERVTDLEGLLDYTVVPNFRVLGPKAGPRLPAIKAALQDVDGADVRQQFDVSGKFTLELPGGSTVELEPDDLEVRARSHEEFALAQDGTHAVALDTAVDEALHREGLAREFVRALNDYRKAIGLQISDRINVQIAADAMAQEAAKEHADYIAAEILAESFEIQDELENAETLEVEGNLVSVKVTKV